MKSVLLWPSLLRNFSPSKFYHNKSGMQVLSKGGYDDGEQAWLQCAGTTSMKILYWLKRYNLQTDWSESTKMAQSRVQG